MKNSGSSHISVQNKIVGIRYNHIDEAVLTSTHNRCFWAEITNKKKTKKQQNVYPCKHQFYDIKVGCKGIKIT